MESGPTLSSSSEPVRAGDSDPVRQPKHPAPTGRDLLTIRANQYTEAKSILTVALGGAIVLLPLIIWGFPEGADLINHYRFALPFYESIRSGHFYPGWLAESNSGFGDARFRFYPPGLYYILAGARLLAGWYWASILAFALLTITGGLGIYLWARNSFPAKVAMWAGLIYVLTPYHLNELYQASLLSEYAACSILPFAFAFVERVCRKNSMFDVAGLATFYSLLILMNLPLTVIGSLAILVYALFLLRRATLWASLIRLAVGFGAALAASSFYWTTVVAELPWIVSSPDDPKNYYDYRGNFLFSPTALTNRNTWYANILALALLGFIAPAVILLRKKAAKSGLPATAALTLISFVMATELSRPLWALVPKLREVQFPWRWLAITSMGGSILLAAGIPTWKEHWRKLRPLYVIPAVWLVLSLIFVASEVIWDSDYKSRQEFDYLMVNIRGGQSFRQCLPVWAPDNNQIYQMKDLAQADGRKITIESWEPEHRAFHIEGGPQTEAKVHTFYYPLWSSTLNGHLVPTKPAEDGALVIAVPPEAGTIKLDFREPPRVQRMRVVSVLGWLLILALGAYGTRQIFSRRPRLD